MRLVRRTVHRGVASGIAAIAAAAVLATPAAASTSGVLAKEGACAMGQTLCNTTYGTGNSVGQIVAWRNTNVTGEIGFFEIFGPGSYKKTGPTNRDADHTFDVNASFPRGSLLCVTFWRKNTNGSFTKYGGSNGNACTSTPIG
ncbi:hypothetical protein JOF56_006111 [Kibdelosporangium banguiense]|uniref:Peptidase inhibitor family I36 n=1 Tax=Kibdelosporangium banguiense TaxID=1365924 RepID=A0ABS4TMT4_9PSEU|nr:hypothetical protein [Kibdelosporangium banguiense]MBP2325726.1 hypothetical protein [Kibdelosporangium banguiense]